MIKFILTVLLALFFVPLSAAMKEDLLKEVLEEGVNVDLRNPTYSEGSLSTKEGGVITASQIRIQAQNIIYTHIRKDKERVTKVKAEGLLMVEYGDFILIGESLEFDFETQTGTLYNGITSIEPWYFGGESIDLLPGKIIKIEQGYLTTSDRDIPSWKIQMQQIVLTPENYVSARNLYFKIGETPIFWFPFLRTNLDWITDSPLRYRVRVGGSQGFRIGVIYEMLGLENFKAFLRADYRLNRGPGVGLSTEYYSPDQRELFETVNYIARDTSIGDSTQRTRYRFNGIYSNSLLNDDLQIDFTYDKVSDKNMPTDYSERGLDLETAMRTRLLVRRQWDEAWIANLNSEVRINTFQSMLQQLPTLSLNLHPRTLGNTGVISESQIQTGYLDFLYAHGSRNVNDYHSTRVEYNQKVYRPFTTGAFTTTPGASFLIIYYGNGPSSFEQTLTQFTLNADFQTKLFKEYGYVRHVIEPYASYLTITRPTSLPDQHFIFDITDGRFWLNTVRFGARNLLYFKKEESLFRNLWLDTYAYAFFNTRHIPITIPYLYADMNWYASPVLRYTLGSAWDVERGNIGHFNLLAEYTFNADLSFAIEYRHRNAFAWRKLDYNNFNLDAFRSEAEMLTSALSDRRDTLLFDLYYRFWPNWSIHSKLRHGWNRQTEPTYTEYEIDLITTWQKAWDIRLSYQHREDDQRFALYFSLGLDQP